MSKETEKSLIDAYEKGDDIEAELIHHFDDFGRWSSIDITEEALRLSNLVFKLDVEEGDPLDTFMMTLISAGQKGAYAAVAAAFGLDADMVQCAMAEWEDHQDDAPKAVSFKEFQDLMSKQRIQLADMVETSALTEQFLAKLTAPK